MKALSSRTYFHSKVPLHNLYFIISFFLYAIYDCLDYCVYLVVVVDHHLLCLEVEGVVDIPVAMHGAGLTLRIDCRFELLGLLGKKSLRFSLLVLAYYMVRNEMCFEHLEHLFGLCVDFANSEDSSLEHFDHSDTRSHVQALRQCHFSYDHSKHKTKMNLAMC